MESFFKIWVSVNMKWLPQNASGDYWLVFFFFLINIFFSYIFFQPSNLVPFNIKQKQFKQNNGAAPSYIRYVELNFNGNQYRLLNNSYNDHTLPITINGILRSAPYSDNDVKITRNGAYELTSSFGLKITWDGWNRNVIILCDAYSTYICGLCGNYNGKTFLFY